MNVRVFDDSKRFKVMGSQRLTEWVLRGEHFPPVTAYYEAQTGDSYQVCRSAMLYRVAKRTPNSPDIAAYGAWQRLTES